MVLLMPRDNAAHCSPVLSLITFADPSNDGIFSRKVLEMVGLWAVVEVPGEEVEEVRR